MVLGSGLVPEILYGIMQCSLNSTAASVLLLMLMDTFDTPLSFSIVRWIRRLPMIFATTGLIFGISRPSISATFFAIFGNIWVIIFSFSLRWESKLWREMNAFMLRATSWTASLISFAISGVSAMASFDSDVKGTFVDATCTRITAGPAG